MTRADAAKLVAIIVTAYPNFDKFKDAQAVASTVDLWAAMFADDDGRIVGLAVKKHIATSKWPPSVAELREIMLEMQRPELLAPDIAWAAVSDMLESHGEYETPDLGCYLPPLVARAVEVIGYRTLYEMHRGRYGDSRPGMDRMAFVQQYTPMYEREKARGMTPGTISAQIEAIANAMPDGGRYLLKELQQDRLDHENMWRQVAGQPPKIMITASNAEINALQDKQKSMHAI